MDAKNDVSHSRSRQLARARVSRVPGKQDVSFQMWMRRRLGFVFSADLCRAWDPLGGLAARLSKLAATPSMASARNCIYSTIYHEELVRFLADSCYNSDWFRNYLSGVKEDICKLIPRDAFTAQTRTGPARAPRNQSNTNDVVTKAPAPTPRNRKGYGRIESKGGGPPLTLRPRLTEPS